MSFRLIDAVISDETDGLTDSRKLETGRGEGREAAKRRRRIEFTIWRRQREMVRRNFADFAGFRRTLCFRIREMYVEVSGEGRERVRHRRSLVN